LGLVSLEDPVTKFLPEHAHRTGWSEVTLGHLLSHTSGFGSYWGPDFDARRTALVTVQAHFQLFEQTPLAFAPGTRFDYSNVGFILLGAVIERVTGQDYFAYVQQHVFDPASMRDTGFVEADADTPNLAVGYTYRRLDDDPSRGPARTHTHLKPFKGSQQVTPSARHPTWCASPRHCSMERSSNARHFTNSVRRSTAWPRHQACQPCSLGWASW